MLVIVAIMTNHGLIRLKKFVSRFTTKLCNCTSFACLINYTFFLSANNVFICHLHLMLHACVERFDGISEKFLCEELNKAELLDLQII
jgi:hypothetical protein